MEKTNLEKTITLRHELHKYPELSLHEEKTLGRIREFLLQNTSLEVVDRDGWLFAVKRAYDPEAEQIAFRADMDALPIEEAVALPYASSKEGISHKCGHDGHCAALCGLALALDQMETSKTVYLIFQPAEEIGAGGKVCAKLIKEKGIREVYAFHNLGGYPEGAVVFRRGLTQPASEGMEIRFFGKSSHASAPEEGRNPSVVISEIVLYIHKLLKETHSGMVLCTVTGIHVGTGDFGISPGDGTLRLTLRAEYEEELKTLKQEVMRFADQLAAQSDLQTKYQFFDYFPETKNSTQGIDRVLAAAKKMQIPTIEMSDLWRASEDFGYYLKECDGAMFYIGNGENWPALHTKEYDFNDRILETAVDMLTLLAMEQEGYDEA
ncbi:MAG: amidohydrolase [Lachnospiraceae bacterium]|nr:amidohydrolase [Lachnospiraceae bacterium]